MAWVAVGVSVVGGAASLYGAYKSGEAAEDAADAQAAASAEYQRTLNRSADEIAGYAEEYVNTLNRIDNDFDPYDMEEAFNSLYEAIIQPMERDFDENVLPGIQAAYSGGIVGASAGLSGAASEATSRAERGQAETKANLRYQERGNAIARNYTEYDRRISLAKERFGGQSVAPNTRAGFGQEVYGAKTDTIAASLAANQAQSSVYNQLGGTLMSGATLASNLKLSNSVNDLSKTLNPRGTK